MTDALSPGVRAILERLDLDPDTLVPDPDPVKDADEWMTQMATDRLMSATPRRFQVDIPLRPEVAVWAEQVAREPAAGSLLLCGDIETGKTHEAWMALRTVILGARRFGHRLRWKAVTHGEFNAATLPKSDESHHRFLADCQRTDVLLFDDLGADTRPTEYTQGTLLRLADHRWQNDQATIWTTNLTNDGDWQHRFGPRAASRIADGEIVFFASVR